MEKYSRYLPVGLIVLAIILIGYFYSSNSKLGDALEKLNQANKSITEAISKVDSAKVKINELQSNLSNYGMYVKDIQGRVEIDNLERRLKNAKDKSERDSIYKRLKDLGNTIDLTGEELPKDPVRPK